MSGYEPASIDVYSDFRNETSVPPTRAVPKPHASFGPSKVESTSLAGSISTYDVIQTGPPLEADTEASLMSNLLVWPTADGEKPIAMPTVKRGAAEAAVVRPQPNGLDQPELPAQVESASSERPPHSPPAAVKPVWEVDRFRWPSPCDQLIEEEGDYFGHAGQKLCDASRRGLKILAVTAFGRSEGCTTLAVCLARAATAAGARVVLMDTDLQHPQLGTKLGLDFSQGWCDVLREGMPWNEAAVTSLEDGLTLLPATAPRAAPVGEIVGPGFARLVNEVATHFDLLILDGGQLDRQLRSLLSSGTGCAANAAIVVRDLRRTSEENTVAAAAQLKSMGVQAVGIAENFIARRSGFAAA